MIDFDDNCSKKCDLASSSSFAPRDSLSKLSLSSRLVVSSRQAKVSKLPFWSSGLTKSFSMLYPQEIVPEEA